MNDSMLNIFISKESVATRFAKAHFSYVHQAQIQKNVAQHLNRLIKLHVDRTSFSKVFEIGCGTGNLTHLLLEQLQIKQLFLNDLYPEIISSFEHIQAEWCIGDIEKTALPQQLEMCVSSSALQWMTDLEKLIQRFAIALNPHGYFCFSSYGPSNFKEIKSLTGQGLDYFSFEQTKELLESNGFEILYAEQHLDQLYFAHPKSVLKHIQATGVSATNSSFRWTKQSLNQFYLNYRQFITTDEQENLVYPLTYHPIYVIARRKP